MIHYGLQYRKLLHNSADEVASARSEIQELELQQEQAQLHLQSFTEPLTRARQRLEDAKKALNKRIDWGPINAVDEYKSETGAYPI